MHRLKIVIALAVFAAALPLALQAQTVRCVGKDGKKYFGQTVPAQCVGQAVEYLDKSGNVVKRVAAALTPEQRAAREAEDRKNAEAAAVAKDEARRNRALLETYTSEKDIDFARQRTLKDNEVVVKEIESRIAQIEKRRQELKKEMEFYQGKNKPPAKLAQDVANNEIDLNSQQQLLNAKKKEVESINAKYDDDKKRFMELSKGGTAPAEAPAPAPAAKTAAKK
jgi:chromosome segregation ATPase